MFRIYIYTCVSRMYIYIYMCYYFDSEHCLHNYCAMLYEITLTLEYLALNHIYVYNIYVYTLVYHLGYICVYAC